MPMEPLIKHESVLCSKSNDHYCRKRVEVSQSMERAPVFEVLFKARNCNRQGHKDSKPMPAQVTLTSSMSHRQHLT